MRSGQHILYTSSELAGVIMRIGPSPSSGKDLKRWGAGKGSVNLKCSNRLVFFKPALPLVVHRLVNRSGLRLTYWADNGSGAVNSISLNAWEESPLLVEPVEKTVLLPDSQQQVLCWRALRPCQVFRLLIISKC